MHPWYPFRAATRWISLAPEFRSWLEDAELFAVSALASPALGNPVVTHRSSWVRLLSTDLNEYYVKTYDYPTLWSRCRGIGRNTALAASRVRREDMALRWLRQHNFGGPYIAASAEETRWGMVRRGVLITEAWPGADLAHLLPQKPPAAQARILGELGGFVRRLHASGFRDRNLDLRNLLAREESDGWTFVKIDSPRFRIVKGGVNDDLARADWTRLRASIEAAGADPRHLGEN